MVPGKSFKLVNLVGINLSWETFTSLASLQTAEMEGDKKEAAAETVEKAAESVEAVTAKDQAEEAVAKKKATTGLYFSDIPKDVRVSEFKNVLRFVLELQSSLKNICEK